MNLSKLTDQELKKLCEQVLKLHNVGITKEEPLKSLIDKEFAKKNMGAIFVVSTNILMEVANRWCALQN